MKKTKVIVVEDHPLMRKGIRTLIEDASDFEVVGEAGSLSEARQAIAGTPADILLLDISLPDGSGLDFVPMALGIQPSIDVVIMTMHREEPYIARALSIGAAGYVVKDMAPERLIETLEAVTRGEMRFNSTKSDPGKRAVPETAKLSAREVQVLDLLKKGLTLTQTAEELRLSVKTVFTYRDRVMEKLGVSDHEELKQFR